jgi:PAS domain S-box-containing protein
MAGRIVRTLGVVTDMTARRKAERERDRLFEIAQDLIIIVGFDGVLRDVNPAVETALGYGREELFSIPYIDFVHPEDRAKALNQMERLIAGESGLPLEVRYRHSDGTWRWTAWRTTVIREEALLYSVGRDTTERRRTEEALRQAQKMEAVGLLTGGFAHDFSNLLTVIMGNLGLLRRQVAAQPRASKLIEAMQQAAEGGDRLVGQLLAFSRQQTLRPETIDINALIRHFEPLIRPAVGESIKVETRLEPVVLPCTIDSAQLEAALLNLAMNARDAMPTGGRLTIETQKVEQSPEPSAQAADATPEAFVVVTVHDTGTGMPPEAVERAVEPFFTTKEHGKGSGLGLSQVYGFIKQTGGHVTIDSKVGEGTSIRLYLPSSTAEVTEAPSAPEAASDAELSCGSGRILLVEDNAAVRRTTADMMTDLGYEVRAADGPLEALEVLRDVNQPIDLLFCDVMMPHMNGIQLAMEAERLRPGLRVLLTSGYTPESLSPQVPLKGTVPLINKPYTQVDLRARLHAMFDQR